MEKLDLGHTQKSTTIADILDLLTDKMLIMFIAGAIIIITIIIMIICRLCRLCRAKKEKGYVMESVSKDVKEEVEAPKPKEEDYSRITGNSIGVGDKSLPKIAADNDSLTFSILQNDEI